MNLVFVHGWSVRSTETYGELPARLEKDLGLTATHIYLGKYISFDDAVTLDDLAQAFDAALRESGVGEFACFTHSTGGPLLRHWYLKNTAQRQFLKKLVMLAPANHGSALAQLGKGRLSRIKAFFDGVEPGQRILDWLELGSEEQWALNRRWLESDPMADGLEVYVLAGDTIDAKLYDHLNSYTGEVGGDGVVRLASANLNYEYVRLEQSQSGELLPVEWRRAPQTPLRILPLSHSGDRIGIMTSVAAEAPHPTVDTIREIFQSQGPDHFRDCGQRWAQANQSPHALSMLVFRVIDEQGEQLTDYDLYFTAGPERSPDALPRGFFRDRQRNSKHPGKLSYFLEHGKIAEVPLGLHLVARPDEGLVFYKPAFISPARLEGVIRPHETLMIEIVMRRYIDKACFQLTRNRKPERFGRQPLGETIPEAA